MASFDGINLADIHWDLKLYALSSDYLPAYFVSSIMQGTYFVRLDQMKGCLVNWSSEIMICTLDSWRFLPWLNHNLTFYGQKAEFSQCPLALCWQRYSKTFDLQLSNQLANSSLYLSRLEWVLASSPLLSFVNWFAPFRFYEILGIKSELWVCIWTIISLLDFSQTLLCIVLWSHLSLSILSRVVL